MNKEDLQEVVSNSVNQNLTELLTKHVKSSKDPVFATAVVAACYMHVVWNITLALVDNDKDKCTDAIIEVIRTMSEMI